MINVDESCMGKDTVVIVSKYIVLNICDGYGNNECFYCNATCASGYMVFSYCGMSGVGEINSFGASGDSELSDGTVISGDGECGGITLYFGGCGVMTDECELFIEGECFLVDTGVHVDSVSIGCV